MATMTREQALEVLRVRAGKVLSQAERAEALIAENERDLAQRRAQWEESRDQLGRAIESYRQWAAMLRQRLRDVEALPAGALTEVED